MKTHSSTRLLFLLGLTLTFAAFALAVDKTVVGATAPVVRTLSVTSFSDRRVLTDRINLTSNQSAEIIPGKIVVQPPAVQPPALLVKPGLVSVPPFSVLPPPVQPPPLTVQPPPVQPSSIVVTPAPLQVCGLAYIPTYPVAF